MRYIVKVTQIETDPEKEYYTDDVYVQVVADINLEAIIKAVNDMQ